MCCRFDTLPATCQSPRSTTMSVRTSMGHHSLPPFPASGPFVVRALKHMPLGHSALCSALECALKLLTDALLRAVFSAARRCQRLDRPAAGRAGAQICGGQRPEDPGGCCIDHRAGQTLPLPCGTTAFVAKGPCLPLWSSRSTTSRPSAVSRTGMSTSRVVGRSRGSRPSRGGHGRRTSCRATRTARIRTR